MKIFIKLFLISLLIIPCFLLSGCGEILEVSGNWSVCEFKYIASNTSSSYNREAYEAFILNNTDSSSLYTLMPLFFETNIFLGTNNNNKNIVSTSFTTLGAQLVDDGAVFNFDTNDFLKDIKNKIFTWEKIENKIELYYSKNNENEINYTFNISGNKISLSYISTDYSIEVTYEKL